MRLAWAMIVSTLLAGRAFALNPQKAITQFTHRSWGPAQGITEVYSIAQTTDGYLWLATAKGTFRFDGVEFTPAEPEPFPSAFQGYPYRLLGTPDGSLWVTRSQCVLQMKDGHINVYWPKDGLPDGTVNTLCLGTDGAIWVGANSGISRFFDGHWQKMGPETGFPGGPVETVMVDHENTLWLALGNEFDARKPAYTIAFLRHGETQFRTAGDAGLQTKKLAEGPDGKIWAAQLSRSVRSFVRDQDGLHFLSPEIRVGSEEILFDRDGTLWVASMGDGLRRVRNFAALGTNDVGQFSDSADTFTQKDGLSSDVVICSFEDREGNVWFGSPGGLDCFSENKVSSLSAREGLPFDQNLLLEASPDGCVWAGSTPRGFAQIKPEGTQFLDRKWLNLTNEMVFAGVSSIYSDPAGGLLFGTMTGVLSLDPKAERATALPVAGELKSVTSMTRDHEGALWICNGSVYRLKDGHLEKMTQLKSDLHDSVIAIHTDREGRVWLGRFAGTVACYEDNQFHLYSHKDGLFEGTVREIISDAKGRLWVVGKGGISRFAKGRFQTLTHKNGLPDDSISAVQQDEDGFFWLASFAGIFRVAPDELENAFTSASGQVTGELFDMDDGLRGFIHGPRELTGKAGSAKSTDGRLWFATGVGLAIIDPRHIPRNPLPPPVHIQQITAAEKIYRTSEKLEFPIGTKNCQIDYAGLSFVNPTKVRYKYKLTGYDQEWQEAGTRRQAFYSGLKPDKYHFQVLACNNDGVWNETGDSVEFSILPALYERTLFPIVYLLPVALALLAVYRMRLARMTNRLKLQLEGQDKERKRIAQELHDTLLQGFTGIGLKLDALANNPPDSPDRVRDQLQKILEQSDQYLTDARRAVWELRSASLETTDDFSKTLSDSGKRLLEGTGIELIFRVEGEQRKLARDVESNLLRICEETVTNAVKHARPTQVRVELKFTNGDVQLRIQDNGCGFNPRGPEASKAGHFGLVGIRERTKSMGGSFRLNSEPVKGTEIVITVPVARK